MDLVMLEQRQRQSMRTGYQIEQRETNPDLPKIVRTASSGLAWCMPMLGWREAVQHKAVNKIFGKSPSNHATDEWRSVSTHSEMRNRQQQDCKQRGYQHFAEIDDRSHD